MKVFNAALCLCIVLVCSALVCYPAAAAAAVPCLGRCLIGSAVVILSVCAALIRTKKKAQ